MHLILLKTFKMLNIYMIMTRVILDVGIWDLGITWVGVVWSENNPDYDPVNIEKGGCECETFILSGSELHPEQNGIYFKSEIEGTGRYNYRWNYKHESGEYWLHYQRIGIFRKFKLSTGQSRYWNRRVLFEIQPQVARRQNKTRKMACMAEFQTELSRLKLCFDLC